MNVMKTLPVKHQFTPEHPVYRCRWISLLFAFVLCSVSSALFAQEICDNGIDDDADGLVDLNDSTDCRCIQLGPGGEVPSFLPNPSFEEYTFCPSSFSELFALVGWSEATSATTDYLNTCGYTSNTAAVGLQPFPDGNGVVGGFYTASYKEYIGMCLPTTLQAGVSYSLTIDIAGTLQSPGTEICAASIDGLYPPVNVTLFGAPSCANIPSYTFACPIAGDPAWTVLGSTSYAPVTSWGSITITFTPAVDIASVMLGSPCFLPLEYPDSSEPGGGNCYAYFFYDRFILNETEVMNTVLMSVSGTRCSTPTLLSAELSGSLPAGAGLQWYLNGAAIPGATGETYIVPLGAPGFGDYQVVLTNGGGCLSSAAYTVNTTPPVAAILGGGAGPYAVGSTVQLTDASSGASTISWVLCDGTSNTDTVVQIVLDEAGECCVQLTVEDGTCSDVVELCLSVTNGATIVIPNVFTPNGDGSNDVFQIESEGVTMLSCTIYNRWGTVVHEWKNNVSGTWNGRSNGSHVSSGTYYYVVDYVDLNNISKSLTGSLTLLDQR